MSIASLTVSLVACHGGPAAHFAEFTKQLPSHIRVEIHASGPALKQFQDLGVEVNYPFSIADDTDSLASQIAKTCASASLVITDVGHPFDIKIQQALKEANIRAFAYYDNPELYVPGGYSDTARQVMEVSTRVLFANKNLVTQFLKFDGRGIGYYSIDQAETIAKARSENQDEIRKKFLKEDASPKILVYFGGNNETYFNHAFPAALEILQEDMKNNKDLMFFFQQHPGAKKENRDIDILNAWMELLDDDMKKRIVISSLSSLDAQVLADVALYYQTSMSPLWALAGIPCVQIGHEPYQDMLVTSGFVPAVVAPGQLSTLLDAQPIPREKILEMLGYDPEWKSHFLQVIQER
ncbi:MAG: hypothetical protein RLZZ453_804 [Chlamydiota bacterium]|jgi:hypothetical protein